jgi:hypothetical protein
MTFAQLAKYMRECWPFDGKINRVREGYIALGRVHALTLADIAMRNGVYRSPPEGADAIALARFAGRQEAALEIIMLSRADAPALFALIETKPAQRS